jgi:hypothetical protein
MNKTDLFLTMYKTESTRVKCLLWNGLFLIGSKENIKWMKWNSKFDFAKPLSSNKVKYIQSYSTKVNSFMKNHR